LRRERLVAVLPWFPRATVGLLAAMCAGLAWWTGGGADARLAPPRPSEARTAPDAGAHPTGGDAYEVSARLIELLGDARIDVPSLAASQPYFSGAWRKLRGPWVHPAGPGGDLAYTFAMRTSRDAEKQWSVGISDGGAWTPQAKIWNMNEGSFDQREAIYAPTPATLTFSLSLPPHARLRLAPAVAVPSASTTVFEVAVVDPAGQRRVVSETRIAGGDPHSWNDVDVDLDAYGGQRVELELRTRAVARQEGERAYVAAGADSDEAHAGPAPMSLALWGDPMVVGLEPTRLPFDVLWIVVDALRPDTAASLHDAREDAARASSARPPLEALLPAVPGLLPNIDALAARGVHFQHAWSAAAWTRPGTLAMLTGERSSELGMSTLAWVLPAGEAAHFYASDPPLLPRILRKSGAVTAAFVNNFFMAGYVAVGIDMGFEHVTDHRYRTRDTAEITKDALAWLDAHGRDRFYLFVNYNSPHEPFDPPREMVDRVPHAPAGPSDPQVREYMAEGAKDDAAIGELLAKLEALGLTKRTLVLVTADHGETLSSAHEGMGLERVPVRFHHAVGNFEETTRIPIVMSLPGVLEGGKAVADRVRNTDIAPTLLQIEGLEPDPRLSGRSLLPLVRGEHEPDRRVVVSEGRGSRAILWGKWHMILFELPKNLLPPATSEGKQDGRSPALPGPGQHQADTPSIYVDSLFDLEDDPGERHNVYRSNPDVVAELKARLAAALANAKAADAVQQEEAGKPAVVHVRFAGGGQSRRVAGALTVGDGKHGPVVKVEPVGVASESLRVDGPRVEIALTTAPDAVVGFDLRIDPAGAPVAWQLTLDDAPWPSAATYAGPFGLPAVASKGGIASDEARREVFAEGVPFIDPARDTGMFVTRDRPGEAAGGGSDALDAEGSKEMQRVLQDWGYAHGSH
jgi:arylsulfatase A-like enzyme